MKILIADDEMSIRKALENILEKDGHECCFATTGMEVMPRVKAEHPDLVILDIMMPEMNGFDACEELRAAGYQMPILMLSAKGDIVDKSMGFKAGADDYIVKPFEPQELRMRVNAGQRRTAYQMQKVVSTGSLFTAEASLRGGSGQLKEKNVTEVGDLKIYFDQYRVTKKSRQVNLTTKEFEVLALMAANPGSVFSREEILNFLWGDAADKDLNSVTVFVRRIREKIEDNPSKPEYIQTVWMVGYKFRAE